jgi:hypothetical protein
LRLAEFKTRLFIFCAGRLLKWAESIQRELKYSQSPPATPVDDSSEVLFGESARESEAASGPPEHWARLVASRPPKHWLDLIREKAPHLLPPTEDEPLSPQIGAEGYQREFFKAEINQEAGGPPASEDGAVERSQPLPFLQARQNRGETKYSYPAKAGKSTWLNRLRFQPPRRAKGGEPPNVSDARSRYLESFPAAGGAAGEGSESTLHQPTFVTGKSRDQSPDPGPDKTTAARQNMARLSSNFRNEEPDSNRPRQTQAGTESGEWPRIHSEPAGQDSLSNQAVKQSRPERTAPETGNDARHANRLNIFVERGDTDDTSTRTPSRYESITDHYVESSPRKRSAPFRQSDRRRGVNFKERGAASSSAGVFHQVRVDEAAVESTFVPSRVREERTKTREIHHGGPRRVTEDGSAAPVSATVTNRHVPNQPFPSRRPLANVVTSDEQARNEFASVDLTAPTPVEPRIESGKNVWPTLPPAPKFDLADELAAKDQEAEGLRRLEQEQRGTLWNE